MQLRVSSEISNGRVILNVDCDMYSNNSQSIREALCFFMDEKKSQDIGFVQFPQMFENTTKNDLYGSALQVISAMGLKYGCPVEDVITGLAIQCRGWKSVYLNPERSGFLGVAATSLGDALVQHKRWGEGDLQIMLSYCPFWYGYKSINLGLQLGYCNYCLWAVNSLATLCYCTIPSLYMLGDISLFPQLSSIWFLPFAYIAIAKYTYSLAEFLRAKGTVLGWWNEQRIWLYKRTSSYFFAIIDTTLKVLGFSQMKFVISNKVTDDDVLQRYEKEIMEFGVPSPMFTLLASLALMNLFSFLVLIKMLLVEKDRWRMIIERLSLQILLCGVLVLINLPLFKALFVRKDKGRMPSSVTIKATIVSIVIVLYFCH
ncbi:Cellulose synthase-like protein E1 [Bienertia sinuspersici]